MASLPSDINYTFSPEEIALLRPYGEVRRHGEGDLLVGEGDRECDCLITLSGETHIFVEEPAGPRRVGWMETGQFAGDITVLTGHAALARTIMGVAGEVLHIPFTNLQRVLVENSRLSDVFVRTFTARRAFAMSQARASVIVIGSPFEREVFAVRDFLSRHSVPHIWFDPETDDLAAPIMKAKALSAEDLPAVVFGASDVLKNPTVEKLAEKLGFDLLPDGATADLIVIGAGPAGLAAAVYAGSEGLTALALDSEGPGGQAGTSSKIENYLGFPAGVSGRELAERAAIQAQKFGVRIAAPARVANLEQLEDGHLCVELADSRRFRSRAVVISTGAQYRRLPIPRLEEFEGRGIYYGASHLEAQLCSGASVCVVGAGNSAGQGAMFLSGVAQEVHVLYRRADIRETMSDYLVRRLEETPNVLLHPATEIESLDCMVCPTGGPDRMTGITVKSPAGTKPLATPFVFLFIGAAPFTQWLNDSVARDERGFLKTGTALQHRDLVRAKWPLERMPSTYETSWPRVYAVGDVRSGSVKRVASSVGEGSVVVSAIHAAISDIQSL